MQRRYFLLVVALIGGDARGQVHPSLRYLQDGMSRGDSWATYYLARAHADALLEPSFKASPEIFEELSLPDTARPAWTHYRRLLSDLPFTPNLFTARNILERCVERDFPECMALYGRFLQGGVGFPKPDQVEATRWYMRAAQAGSHEGMLFTGIAHETGQSGLEKDQHEAMGWFYKAAQAGNKHAFFRIGVSLGRDAKTDAEKRSVVEWYRRGAEKGSEVAMCELGYAYLNGTGIGKDEREALRWFSRASLRGNMESLLQVGFSYESGRGVERNPALARESYLRASSEGKGEVATAARKRLKAMEESESIGNAIVGLGALATAIWLLSGDSAEPAKKDDGNDASERSEEWKREMDERAKSLACTGRGGFIGPGGVCVVR